MVPGSLTRRCFVVGSVVALSGCVTTSRGGDGTPTKTTADSDRTPSPTLITQPSQARTEADDGVFLGVTNDTYEEHSVEIAIHTDGEQVYDETILLDAGERKGQPAVITEPGEYRITVEIDPETSRTLTQQFPDENNLPVDRYILEVEIRADDVTFAVLHEDPTPTPPGETSKSSDQ